MKSRSAVWPVATALLFAGAPALAATATVISYVDSSYNPNGVGIGSCVEGISSSYDRSCHRLNDAPLLATDPDGVETQVTFHRELFSPGNTGQVPNRVLDGTARAYALPGSLHANVEVRLDGFGGGIGGGVTGLASAQIEDRIKVSSATLAKDTAVVMTTQLDVSGKGRGNLSLTIRASRPGFSGLVRVFDDSNYTDSESESLQSIAGQFTAYVGESLYLDYYLNASTGVSNAGWTQIDVLNGRARNSDYGNSAYLYFASVDPAVEWISDSGALYRVAEVPEPRSWAMMLLGLAALGAIAKRRRLHGLAALR
jgi:PEP-CTERM motif